MGPKSHGGGSTRSFLCSAAAVALGLVLALSADYLVREAVRGAYLPTPEEATHQAPTIVPLYDFRSRNYTYDPSRPYRVEWMGVLDESTDQLAALASPWQMQERQVATIRITRLWRNMSVSDMSKCSDSGLSDDIHVVLEGPAILAPLRVERESETVVLATITAYDVGNYNVHVEAAFRCQNNTMGAKEFRRLLERPAQLRVTEASNGLQRLRRRRHKSGFPKTKCTDYRWRHGRWMECHNTPLLCVRTGWVWVPNDCYLPILSREEIVHDHDPTWIVFAGSSIERGSFLSLVDYVLGGSRAANLTESDFWKCWGWMDLTIGNLRVSYLDFRPYRLDYFGRSGWDMRKDYLEQAIAALQDIGRSGDGETGPDVFHLEVPTWYRGQLPPLEYAHIIRSWLGVAWKGRFVLTSSKVSWITPDRYEKPAMYEAFERVVVAPEGGGGGRGGGGGGGEQPYDYLDETNMAAAAMHDTEAELHQPNWSQHYHRSCRRESGDLHVCSVVCDAAAQQILNLAFASSRRSPRRHRNTTTATAVDSTPLKFCLNCPPTLVPFTVKPWSREQGTRCHQFVPASRV